MILKCVDRSVWTEWSCHLPRVKHSQFPLLLVYSDHITHDRAVTCTSNVLLTTGGNGVCYVGGVTLVGYRWPNEASAWATLCVACVLEICTNGNGSQ